MADDKPVSAIGRRYVADKLEQLMHRANFGSGLHYELFSQNFTDAVDGLASRMKRADLRAHLLDQAERTGNYMGPEKHFGRWDYDQELGEVRWMGETPEHWKHVDFEGQWVRKSVDERARYVTGHFGQDSRTQNDYPGIQVEKNGKAGPVKWGPEQPTGQDAQEYAEKMLDAHLGFEAPKIAPSSVKDIQKSNAMSERLRAKVLTKPYRKYIRESAKVGNSPAQKYGGSDAMSDVRPPRRSR
jgi:hypothetical protein